MNHSPLSKRAQALSGQMSPLVIAHFECVRDPFHPKKNPGGGVNLGTAANHLMDDELLKITSQELLLQNKHLHYEELHGMRSLREAVCGFFQTLCSLRNIDPENLVVGNGSSSLLESLAFALFDPGDAIIIPAPYYTGFEYDFAGRFGVKVLPAPMRVSEHFALNAEIVKETHAQALKKGENVRAILLTNPANPTGAVASQKELRQIISFVRQNDLHLISDEIYMQSVYHEHGEPFRSVFQLEEEDRRNLHLIYGVAKDFCLSGFKSGFFYSQTPSVVAAMQAAGYFNVVSNHTQALLEKIFRDHEACEQFLTENRRRLAATHSKLSRWLESNALPHIPARAGLFCFADFSRCMDEPTFDGEFALYQKIWKTQRVNITPGRVVGCPVPGWFRICFAQEEGTLDEALRRLSQITR